jgi:hypothetical protein
MIMINKNINIVKKSVFKIFAVAAIFLPLAFSSCIHDNFEEPPVVDITEGIPLTIDQVYQIHNDSVVALSKQSYKFTDDYSVTGVVIMDDKSGNIYKSAFIQDGTKGINLHLMSSGGLYEGDSIRIKLDGLILSMYAGMMQIDSVDVHKNIVKIATMRDLEPEVVTIDQILTGQYDAKLVKIENVQFKDVYLGTTYADKENLITMNKGIENEFGDTIIVRTSGYASFADKAIPEGRGSIIAVVSKFNEDWQLLIRSSYEVDFANRRFGDVDTLFYEGFANAVNGTAIDFDGWQNVALTGTLQWLGFDNDVKQYAKIDGTGNAALNYLILPQLALNNNKMSFTSRAGNLQNAKLELVISTDFDGTNVGAATWTVIPANFATAPTSGYGSETPSGEINISSYSGNAYVAIRYVAEAGQKANFIIDDILIYSE